MPRQRLDDLLYDATGDDEAMVAALEDEFSLQDIVAKLDAHDGREFADPTANMDQLQSYINRSLAAFGYPSPLQLGSPDAVDISMVCNCLYALLQQRQRDIDYRDETSQAQQRLQSQVNLMEAKQQRLEAALEAKEREISSALAKERVATTQHSAALRELTAERDELQKLANNLQGRHNQHVHEIRRKEREYVKLQERLHALLMEKRRESKASMEIMNLLQREGHKRGTWTGKRPDQDFYKMIVDAYETKQKELVVENADLRSSLRQLQTEMRELLNAHNERDKTGDKARALEDASASISALETQLAAEQHRVAVLQAEVREHREQKGASAHRQLVQIRHLEQQLAAQQKKLADAIAAAERDKSSAIAEAVSAATAATAAAAEREQRRAVAAAIEATATASAMDRAALEQALQEERERQVAVPQLADQAVQTDAVEPRTVDFGISLDHHRGPRDDISIVSITDPAAADLAALPGDLPRDQLEVLLTEKLQRLQKKMETFDADASMVDGSEAGHPYSGALHAGRTSSEYTETDGGAPLGGWGEREMELARQLEYARAIIHEQEAVIQFSLMASNDNPLDIDPVGYRSERQAAIEEDVLEEKLRHIEEERRQAQAAAAKLDEERRELEKTRRMLQEEQESFRTTLQMWAPGLGAGLFLAKTAVSGTSTPHSENGTTRSTRGTAHPAKGPMESINFNAYTDERGDDASAAGSVVESGSPPSGAATPKMRPKPLAMQVDLRRLKEVFYSMDVHGFVDKKQYLQALRSHEEVRLCSPYLTNRLHRPHW
eukprot:jgi/Mesvir1/7537/Mv19284-RA.2